jgi:hemerythrin superfamily protein
MDCSVGIERRDDRQQPQGSFTMTTTQTASKKTTTSKVANKPATAKAGVDAIALLKSDHRKVEDLFDEFEKATRKDRKEKIVEQICLELTVHAQLEEQEFYPPAQAALGDDADLVDEATVEHASLKWLIAQIQSEGVESDLYDAKVKVLQEYVSHHVKEEEKEMFPKLKKTDLDLQELGGKLEAAKAKLMKAAELH